MNDTMNPLFSKENVEEAERVVSQAFRAALDNQADALNSALMTISQRFTWCFSSNESLQTLIGTENPLISRIAALRSQIKAIQHISLEKKSN